MRKFVQKSRRQALKHEPNESHPDNAALKFQRATQSIAEGIARRLLSHLVEARNKQAGAIHATVRGRPNIGVVKVPRRQLEAVQ